MPYENILFEKKNGIAYLTINRPRALNALNWKTMLEIQDVFLSTKENREVKGVLLTGAGEKSFVAGADIKELASKDAIAAKEFSADCAKILRLIEHFPKPVIAAVNGFCLGGGMELVLACRYRIADEGPSVRLGLPEVMLGIHPGFVGSMRLPRLIGPVNAMPLMLSGRTVSSRAAYKLGMVDYAVPTRQMIRAARAIILKPPQPKQPGHLQRFLSHRLIRPLLGMYMRRSVAQRVSKKHYPAPYALLDLWIKHSDDPRTMLAEEAASVARLVVGDTAQNLIRVDRKSVV